MTVLGWGQLLTRLCCFLVGGLGHSLTSWSFQFLSCQGGLNGGTDLMARPLPRLARCFSHICGLCFVHTMLLPSSRGERLHVHEGWWWTGRRRSCRASWRKGQLCAAPPMHPHCAVSWHPFTPACPLPSVTPIPQRSKLWPESCRGLPEPHRRQARIGTQIQLTPGPSRAC